MLPLQRIMQARLSPKDLRAFPRSSGKGLRNQSKIARLRHLGARVIFLALFPLGRTPKYRSLVAAATMRELGRGIKMPYSAISARVGMLEGQHTKG